MSSSQNDQTDSKAVTVIAVFGILLVNGGAVFLIVSATTNPTAFFVASIIVGIAAALVDITVGRLVIAALRKRAARRSRSREGASERA